jgi:hypothetical protein
VESEYSAEQVVPRICDVYSYVLGGEARGDKHFANEKVMGAAR